MLFEVYAFISLPPFTDRHCPVMKDAASEKKADDRRDLFRRISRTELCHRGSRLGQGLVQEHRGAHSELARERAQRLLREALAWIDQVFLAH